MKDGLTEQGKTFSFGESVLEVSPGGIVGCESVSAIGFSALGADPVELAFGHEGGVAL